MNQNNVIFNAENLISTLGIKNPEQYVIEYESDPKAVDITANFFVNAKSKVHNNLMAADIFENTANPGFQAILKCALSADGTVVFNVEFDSPEMNQLLILINQYMQLYKVIADRTLFQPCIEFISLVIMGDYTNGVDLSLDRVYISSLQISVPFESNYNRKFIDIDYVVNEYLEKMELNRLPEHIDFEHLALLVNMQKNLDDMVRI